MLCIVDVPHPCILMLQVLLFYLFVLPVIGLIIVIMWRVYLNVCEHCEKNLTRRHSVVYSVVDIQDLRLRHECCKKNVAPILVSNCLKGGEAHYH